MSRLKIGWLCALAVGGLLALTGTASAAVYNVTTTTDAVGSCDPGNCSLREAIDAANTSSSDDTINVPAGTYGLDPLNGQFTIGTGASGNLDIVGANARTTIVDAGGNSRVFEVESGTVHMSHLTVTGGHADQGAGIYNDSTLVLDSMAVDGNTAVGDGFFGGQGGGLFNDNQVTVTQSSISRNVADGTGNTFSGGQGGGVFNNDQGDYTNVTIANNEAKPATGATFPDGQGGGMFANDVTTLTNVTIAGNKSTGAADNAAGGVFINDQTTFTNTIIATNTVGGAENDCVVNAVVVDGQRNLDGANDCGLGSNNLLNTNPMLGALGDNGGESDTDALLAGSPAIDAAGAAACPPIDQRGVSRPQLSGCDIGAFEFQPAPPAPAPPAPPPATADTTKPTVTVAGVRRACVSSTVRIRVRASDASGIKSTRVTLDGKRVRIRSKTAFTLRINVRKLKPGRHVLRIVTTDKAGNTTRIRRTITRCAKRAVKPKRQVAPRFTG